MRRNASTRGPNHFWRLHPNGRASASNYGMRKRGIIWFCASSAAVGSLFSNGNAERPNVVDDGTVIKNVTVISSERSAPLAHASVVIRNGRIAEIGTDLVAGPHAKQIDGRGGFSESCL